MILKHVRGLYVKYPLLGNVIVYGGLYSAGDLSQQTITNRPTYDFDSTKRVGGLGAGVFGPFYLFWYRSLDKFIPGAAAKAVVKKVVTDQAFAGPVGLFLFFTGFNALHKFVAIVYKKY